MNRQSDPYLSFNIIINFPSLLSSHGKDRMGDFEQFSHEDNLQNAISALDRSVDSRDLDQAIKLGQHAVALADGDWDNLPSLFVTLSDTYAHCFETLGNLDDINSASAAAESAVSVSTEGSCLKVSSLYALAGCFKLWFHQFGKLNDIESAIEIGQLAFSLVPEGDNSNLKSLGLHITTTLFAYHFGHLGESNDLEKLISNYKMALDLIPEGSLNRFGMLSKLGDLLQHRFQLFGDPADLDEAIIKGTDAVDTMPSRSLHRPGSLSTLGDCFQVRFQLNGDLKDLNESISLLKSALSDTLDRYYIDNQVILNNLSRQLQHHFVEMKDANNINEAVSVGQLHIKVNCLSALEVYKVTLDLFPQVPWTGKISEAAECALHWDEADTALEWLEMGWVIVWGQLHNLHSPVDLLSDAHPHLTERLSQVSLALEKATSRDVDLEDFKGSTMEEIAREHHRLATEWGSLVEEIQALPGFEDFLGLKKLATLKNAAKLGPVVILNISFMSLDDVIHILLKDFSYEAAKNLQEQFTKALSAFGILYANLKKNVFMKVLKVLWTCIVKPVLNSLAFLPCDSTNLPRSWWCPTGPLAFLPIHATGDYRINEWGTKLSDYVVSSYTPTLTILLDKLEKTRMFKGVLAVSQPNAPEMSNLPRTNKELQKIKEQVSTKVFVKYLRGKEATPDTVLQGMSTCNCVHMACHATQEKAKPLDSTFHLHPSPSYLDGHLPLSQVIAESFPDADFAYLSACQTTTGDETLTEESVHLAAGMLMAGYQSVVATLWPIRDADAPHVADEVYSRLFEDGKPNSGNAAIVLHHAVQSLRRDVENRFGMSPIQQLISGWPGQQFIVCLPFSHPDRNTMQQHPSFDDYFERAVVDIFETMYSVKRDQYQSLDPDMRNDFLKDIQEKWKRPPTESKVSLNCRVQAVARGPADTNRRSGEHLTLGLES
ncbi:CHAT domain-containing protein [Armillaria luteobubalina]|uniref:CHAT domain-containing protein n=1 Tax=Armillaria luteobubalina TaxID=153913 RepID=A0AA39Q2A3_9AGAR|nr:CHAT domain-containing protein [Armillaria luteobubalina]